MNLAATRCLKQESRTLLFLKKKKQKDSAHWGSGARAAPEINGPKFFGSFFQERTRFFLRAASSIEAGRFTTGSGRKVPQMVLEGVPDLPFPREGKIFF